MRKRKKSIECANCHYHFDLVNNFCPNCGQENHTHKLPIKHFLYEFIESITHFDTKVFTTMKEMATKPGLIVKNYNNNKRARYVPPARIYIFMSFIFFFLLSVLYNHNVHERTANLESEFKKSFSSGKSGHISVGMGKDNLILDSGLVRKIMSIENVNLEKIDSALLVNKKSKTNWLGKRILLTLVRIYKGETSFDEIYLKFIKYISYSLFFFMPFFALVLKIFYRKQHQYYAEFLVFSIYFHTFIFASLIILLLLNKYIGYSNIWSTALAIGMFFYLGLSLKRVFEQSFVKTFFKTLLISLIYLFTMGSIVAMLLVGSLI